MDVDGDFLEPSHESMEVNSAQPNIIAGPSHIAVLSPNKNTCTRYLSYFYTPITSKENWSRKMMLEML